MRIKCFFFLILLLIEMGCVSAGILAVQPPAQLDGQQILKNVRETYKDVESVKANFSQELFISLTDEIQKSEGNLSLQSPDKFCLIYEEPEKQTIVSNGEKVWFYDIEMEQVIIREAIVVDPALNPLTILTQIEEKYEAQSKGEAKVDDKECFQLLLVAADSVSAPAVKEMTIWVDETNWFIRQFQIYNENGDYTVYTLRRIELNPDLEEEKFKFEIPKNVEIIDET
ncbi:MAG: outer membrane lipoprotein carrier protein LolA [Candidatus Cloacimonetes bacterium 4572_55]|nr:MAG: outer membrane lipoprotein carrier protein LolA [Candidatus Cloacimonetes bacterium 4572_55]